MSDFFQDSVEYAKSTLLKSGEFYPMFIGKTVTDESLIIVCPWKDEKEKHQAVNFVRLTFIKEDVCEYCFMSEMWFKTVEKLEDRPKGQICDMPDKKEGMMVIHGKLENGKVAINSEIFATIRDNGIELRPITDGSMQISGTFTEMLSLNKNGVFERQLAGIVLETLEKTVGMKITKKDFPKKKDSPL